MIRLLWLLGRRYVVLTDYNGEENTRRTKQCGCGSNRTCDRIGYNIHPLRLNPDGTVFKLNGSTNGHSYVASWREWLPGGPLKTYQAQIKALEHTLAAVSTPTVGAAAPEPTVGAGKDTAVAWRNFAEKRAAIASRKTRRKKRKK